MDTRDLEYHLPPERIAVRPVHPRDSARLMVVRRLVPPHAAGDGPLHEALTIEHRLVRDLPSILRPGDLMIVNATRVLPARFFGRRVGSGGAVEGLYLGGGDPPATCSAPLPPRVPFRHWTVLLKGGHLRPGVRIRLTDGTDRPGCLELALLDRDARVAGAWTVRVQPIDPLEASGDQPAVLAATLHASPISQVDPLASRLLGPESSDAEILDQFGRTPLPPYIAWARRQLNIAAPDAEDRSLYQTVYAHESLDAVQQSRVEDNPAAPAVASNSVAPGVTDPGASLAGSLAAPTAGLHFTPELLQSLASVGVERDEVVLHVGLGTFKPVDADRLEDHPMHAEWCSMSAATIAGMEARRRAGGRVVAIGTTSVRTLESYAAHLQQAGEVPAWLQTRLLISPGHAWRWTDALLTNFHLPRSTLMALVAATLSTDAALGVARLKQIYEIAIRENYRFYSFGDAMIIV
ncbi:MAG: S-adenosylmethionine:tRNA ribosyltransferase-isomerase [Planctomycetota bacterium]|nr:S-adenosylmethionine:tRNA ribosyltransferase-isomerase [Planctomycetota bacterium]